MQHSDMMDNRASANQQAPSFIDYLEIIIRRKKMIDELYVVKVDGMVFSQKIS